jgi:predicted ribosome quality control (RQC) complex YloA/Tae2 family protein
MHFNYHFLKFLCPELNKKFKNMQVVACFSQNKDELVIGCVGTDEECYFRANLLPVISCLSFPSEFKRGKKNTVSLFPEIIGQTIVDIREFINERAFKIEFLSGDCLVFKLHGTRSNVLFYPKFAVFPSNLFRNELRDDKQLHLEQIDRSLITDFEEFKNLEGNASKFLPTLGKIPREWLKENGYIEADLQQRWVLIEALLELLQTPHYYIIKSTDDYNLSLLPVHGAAIFETSDPIAACNELFRYKVVIQAFEKEKNFWIKSLEDQKKRTQAYLQKTQGKLRELNTETPPSQIADVVMANLHSIPKGAEETFLFNFYTQKEEHILIKRGLSPQKFAENLYRKSKNRKKEINQLEENLEDKKHLLEQIENWLAELLNIQNFRQLRDFVKANQMDHRQKEKEEQVPYKKFEVDGFDILVGKSAKSNDELLRRFAWKEDLWLHAKNVSGSHVLVKFRSGNKYPKSVIERAAELAAYYSKHKNESLAPVIYTPSKYVRKVKGSAPGAVMVDKESVLMVNPKGPDQ